MNYTHYLFAAFVFLLIVSLIVLYDRLKRARMEQQDAIAAKEKRLFTLYQNLEDMMDSMEEYVQNATEETRRQKDELEVMMAKMENYSQSINTAMLMNAIPPPKDKEPAREIREVRPAANAAAGEQAPAPKRAGRKSRAAASRKDESKAEKVFRLQAQGYDADQIAQELALSRGEVALIISLQSH